MTPEPKYFAKLDSDVRSIDWSKGSGKYVLKYTFWYVQPGRTPCHDGEEGTKAGADEDDKDGSDAQVEVFLGAAT